MFSRITGIFTASFLALGLMACASPAKMDAGANSLMADNGIVTVKSAYSMEDSVARLRKDIADKGLMFFQEIDQSKLAADAGITLRPSILLVFGNPGLGAQFMTSNPQAGIDWPVRLLVFQNQKGEVWAEYNDFAYIAKRHAIDDRGAQFKMASEVIASITSSVAQ